MPSSPKHCGTSLKLQLDQSNDTFIEVTCGDITGGLYLEILRRFSNGKIEISVFCIKLDCIRLMNWNPQVAKKQ